MLIINTSYNLRLRIDILCFHVSYQVSFSVKAKFRVSLVRAKTIVFRRTYVLRMMFFFYSTRDLRDAWADRLEILHDGQY